MTPLIITGIIILGLLLIVLEVFVVPGTTVVGIAGIILMAIGIFYTYDIYGNRIGTYSLAGVLLFSFLAIIIGFKIGVWKPFMLKDTVEGKAYKIDESVIKVGDKGKTLTDIRPIGKAIINGKKHEVETHVGYINKNKSIEVIKIANNKIIVNPKT